jgi:hypothetical protein
VSRRRTVPTQLAALAAGVTEATIRKWASRGKLTRYGRPGRAEYDINELFTVMDGGKVPDSGTTDDRTVGLPGHDVGRNSSSH